MPAGVVRFPSYAAVNQSELGSFERFLEKPKHSKFRKGEQYEYREEMPVHRQSDPWSHLGSLGWPMVEVFIAEAVGTAMLMFFGCMGLVRWNPDEPLPPLQPAIVFAVVVATIIQIFGHISAAHLNPAVTICFTLLGQVTPAMAVVYIISECVGAILGYGLLITLTPLEMLALSGSPGVCVTEPHQRLTPVQAVALEFFATFFLVMVVCACSDPRNSDKADSTPLKFGCTVLGISITVGPYTGASMNPARSLAPALWNGAWAGHWIYWLGPCLGGFTATIFYQAIFNRPQIDGLTRLEDAPLNGVKVIESQRKDVKEKDPNNR